MTGESFVSLAPSTLAQSVCFADDSPLAPRHVAYRGRMIPSELERLINERLELGHRPYFVNSTQGTTVVGAFDPIQPIADICDKYGLWLHIDAAWGGGCLLSRSQRHRLAGIERANSVTWNPHKLMGTLLQCSTVHFREDVSVAASLTATT